MSSFLVGNRPKVLIIDDEPMISESLTLVFRQQGYEARAAYSAELALDLLKSWRPDIAIVDIGLARMDGIAFASRLKEAYPECKLLIFSGQSDGDKIVRSAEEKGLECTFVEKPVQPEFLLATASKLLKSRFALPEQP